MGKLTMSKVRAALLFLLILTTPSLFAQETPPVAGNPEQTALNFYTDLLTADAESYGLIASYFCPDVLYRESEYRALVRARSGGTVDVSNLQVSVEPTIPNEAELTISGTVTASDGTLIELPTEPMRMVENGGQWFVCPPNPPALVISPTDLALTPDTAEATVNLFYTAFYTGDTETLAGVVCAHQRNDLSQISSERYGAGRFLLNLENDWRILELTPAGYDLSIQTGGSLRVNRDDGAIIALQDRADFPDAHLVREDGWKFCGGYREVERAARGFLLGFYRYRTEEIAQFACREYQEALIEAAQGWSQRDIQELRTPPDFYNPSLGAALLTATEAEVGNLEQTILLFSSNEVLTPAQDFGSTAALIVEDNRWKWCQLPQTDEEAE